MRYQLRPADRGTPQYGERLWNRQDLAVHFLNGRRQSALRTVEAAQGEHTMRHPCKRSLIIIRFHFNGQHQSGPDLHHVECRIRCAQFVQCDGARLGHALQGSFHNDQVYGSGSDDRRMEKRLDAGRLGCYLPASSRFFHESDGVSSLRRTSALPARSPAIPRCCSIRWTSRPRTRFAPCPTCRCPVRIRPARRRCRPATADPEW